MGVIFKNSVMYNSSSILNYPVCYSEEEREIGCWTDGKPLYQRTLTYTGSSSVTIQYNSSDDGFSLTGITDVYMDKIYPILDTLVSYQVNMPGGTNNARCIYQFEYAFWLDTGKFRKSHNPNVEYIGYVLEPNTTVTFQYTKITDQPGSGSWTPMATPTKQYSETEQVIGTWIDGSPLYEKTIIVSGFNASTSDSGWYYGTVNLSDYSINPSQVFPQGGETFITLQDTTTRPSVFIDWQGGSSVYVYFLGSRSGTLTLTIRYTKTI